MDSTMTDARADAHTGWRRLQTLLALLVLGGCASTSRVQINSTPSGARIVLDGTDCGQTTPASIELDTGTKRHSIRIERAGFNPVEREVTLNRDVDVMDADEAATRVCCAPCTLGCTLLGFLHPFTVNTAFHPSHIDATLEVAGQGARLDVTPTAFEAYVDGKLVPLLDGNYVVTTTGSHELVIKSPGYRDSARTIRVDERMYQRIEVELELEGQGLLLTGSPEGAKVYLDDQFQGTLGDEPRHVRAEPGAHMLRVEADGHRGWQDVVQVTVDRYQALTIALRLEGQGLILRKPDEVAVQTPQIQILVDGQLQGSAFDVPVRTEPGDHDVEIRVSGCETRMLKVRVMKDEYLDVTPGPRNESRREPRHPRSGTSRDQPALRVHAPPGLEGTPERDVEILVDGALVGYGFDNTLTVGASPSEVTVTVRVKGRRPWEQRVRLSSGNSIDLYPRFDKE